ncbi:MAG: hypothetical protein H0W44_08940 [Gammaproteobacteria bacterium]|nr:hypothetical protein [Gammaproteobacteria bacterium]
MAAKKPRAPKAIPLVQGVDVGNQIDGIYRQYNIQLHPQTAYQTHSPPGITKQLDIFIRAEPGIDESIPVVAAEPSVAVAEVVAVTETSAEKVETPSTTVATDTATTTVPLVAPAPAINVTPPLTYEKQSLIWKDPEQYPIKSITVAKEAGQYYKLTIVFFREEGYQLLPDPETHKLVLYIQTNAESADAAAKAAGRLAPDVALVASVPGAGVVATSNRAVDSAALGAEAIKTLQDQQTQLPITSETLSRADKLMDDARRAMAEERYNEATSIYAEVLREPSGPHHQYAQEYLALAHFRMGRYAPAQTEYQHYLDLYPDGEGAERVRQLMAVILTARAELQERRAKDLLEEKRRAVAWQWNGSVSQNLRRSVLDVNVDESNTQGDTRDNGGYALSSNAYIRSGKSIGPTMFNLELSGNHQDDLLEHSGADETVDRFVARLEGQTRKWGVHLGRQSQSSLGAAGRFDGVYGEYRLTQDTLFGFATGSEPSRDELLESDENRRFKSVIGQIDNIFSSASARFYLAEEESDGFINRQGLGVRLNYFDRPTRSSFFVMTDYDLLFGEINFVSLQPTVTLFENLNIGVSIEERNSPQYRMDSVITGQGVSTLRQFYDLTGYTEAQTMELVRAASKHDKQRAVNVSWRTQEGFSLSFNASRDIQAAQPAVAPVPILVVLNNATGIQATGQSVFDSYNFSVSRSDEKQNGSLGVGYSTGANRSSYSISSQTQVRVTETVRLDPGLSWSKSVDDLRNESSNSLYPYLRMEYAQQNNLRFQLDLGANLSWINSNDPAQAQRVTKNFAMGMSYRYSF